MAYDEGGGVEFQNGLLSASRKKQETLPSKGDPVNVFSQIVPSQQNNREPEPVSQRDNQYDEEFAQFEKQNGYGNGGYNPDYVIPDEIDGDLPFV